MTTDEPVCMNCKHLIIDNPNGIICGAFPKGIPEIIITGENDHTEPLPNQDNDIVFEPIDND
jgi:hypothetical protein